MAEWFQKIGPVAVVVLVFTWCCWPYITGSATAIGSKEAGNVPGLPKGLLSPLVKPAGGRNPFMITPAVAELLASELSKTNEGVDLGEDAKTGGNAAAGTVRPSLVLTGTYVRGNHRMAIIDGKIYQAGESLDAGNAAGKPWVVKEIFLDHVVLQRDGEKKDIAYLDPAERRGSLPDDGPSPEGESLKTNAVTSSQDDLKSVTSLSELIQAVEKTQKQKP